jgi:(2Fe-2S) ferredoxin
VPFPFDRHVFVCLNERAADDPRGCCAARGAAQVLDALRREVKARGLSHAVRAQKAGCLDACEQGCAVVVYPEGVWYGRVTAADVPEIVESHLVRGVPVERLVVGRRGPASP